MFRAMLVFASSFYKAAVPFLASCILFLVLAALLSHGDYIQFLKALVRPIIIVVKLACFGCVLYCLLAVATKLRK